MNSTSPPDPRVYFIDRSLGRKVIPEALRTAGLTVRTHDEFFAQDTPDHVWLAEAGRQGWIVITKDTRIRYHAHEKAALLNSGVRAFVLTARGDLTGAEMAAIFASALPAMERVLASTPGPFIARVQRDGSVNVLGN